MGGKASGGSRRENTKRWYLSNQPFVVLSQRDTVLLCPDLSSTLTHLHMHITYNLSSACANGLIRTVPGLLARFSHTNSSLDFHAQMLTPEKLTNAFRNSTLGTYTSLASPKTTRSDLKNAAAILCICRSGSLAERDAERELRPLLLACLCLPGATHAVSA